MAEHALEVTSDGTTGLCCRANGASFQFTDLGDLETLADPLAE